MSPTSGNTSMTSACPYLYTMPRHKQLLPSYSDRSNFVFNVIRWAAQVGSFNHYSLPSWRCCSLALNPIQHLLVLCLHLPWSSGGILRTPTLLNLSLVSEENISTSLSRSSLVLSGVVVGKKYAPIVYESVLSRFPFT